MRLSGRAISVQQRFFDIAKTHFVTLAYVTRKCPICNLGHTRGSGWYYKSSPGEASCSLLRIGHAPHATNALACPSATGLSTQQRVPDTNIAVTNALGYVF